MTNNDKTQNIRAYGGIHKTTSYNDVVKMAADAKKCGANLNITRIAPAAFELVAFSDDYRMDSEYVTLAVGRRLHRNGVVGVMVLYDGPDDEPKTDAAFAALEQQQVYG